MAKIELPPLPYRMECDAIWDANGTTIIDDAQFTTALPDDKLQAALEYMVTAANAHEALMGAVRAAILRKDLWRPLKSADPQYYEQDAALKTMYDNMIAALELAGEGK